MIAFRSRLFVRAEESERTSCLGWFFRFHASRLNNRVICIKCNNKTKTNSKSNEDNHQKEDEQEEKHKKKRQTSDCDDLNLQT